MRIHSINIKEFETNCDGILRQSMKHIFNSETDPITLIKIKIFIKVWKKLLINAKQLLITLKL